LSRLCVFQKPLRVLKEKKPQGIGNTFFDKQERRIYIQGKKIMEKWSLKIIMVSVIHLINYFEAFDKFSPTIPGHFGQVY
jgi:hypothetical protein